jgi:hypothetical protein
MRYRTFATPADALGLGNVIGPEYGASLTSDAVSSATAACFDVSRFVSHVYVAFLYRGKIGTTVSRTSGRDPPWTVFFGTGASSGEVRASG